MLNKQPHLTPATLVGQRFTPDTFGATKIALVGYCPPPAAINQYNSVPTQDQYFIHVPPESVKRLSHNGIEFLSLAHVYGGPVSATTIEELAYYGFEYVLAYGLAGGLGTRDLKMGDFYLVERALAWDGTTPHYTTDKFIDCDSTLKARVLERSRDSAINGIVSVQAVCGDALYREDDAYLQAAREQGCDIVNLDTSHLYAVSRNNSAGRTLKTIQCGVISDVDHGGSDGHWDSTLAVMLAADDGTRLNPLALTGRIVEFYVEQLALSLEA
jgi:hypothetical protein